MSYRALQTLSIAYAVIPSALFLFGWVQPLFALPAMLILLAGTCLAIRSGWNWIEPRRPGHAAGRKSGVRRIVEPILVLVVVAFAVVCSGIGGYATQDADYLKHNAFFADLTRYSWPLAYAQTGPDNLPRVLNTYVGYYLPSALVGKLLGFSAGYFFSSLWAGLGLLLTVLWFLRFVSRPSVFYVLFFLLFGELAFLGWQFFLNTHPIGMAAHYANWMVGYSLRSPDLKGVFWVLGSNFTFLAAAPHHIFPSWICLLMLFHDAVRRESNDRALFLVSLVPLVSAFFALGLMPFAILALVQNGIARGMTFPNLVAAPVLFLLSGLYLGASDAQIVKGWVWEFVSLRDAIPMLAVFYLLGFGIYLLCMPKAKDTLVNDRQRMWLYAAIGCMLLFPLYRIGRFMDFPIKGLNPSWIVFQVCLATAVSNASTLNEKIRGGLVVLCVAVGSLGAFSDLWLAVRWGFLSQHVRESRIEHINEIQRSKPDSLQLFSDGNSFFWRHIAKKPDFARN